MTRAPMISNISDNITNRQKNSILTAYAVGKLFTGVTKTNLNLNTYITPGIIRIDNHATNIPDNVQPKGFLHVSSVNTDEDTSPDAGKYIIRQVLYPDATDANVQTRIGTGNSIIDPISSIVWSDWTEMGGGGDGFTRREELTVNNLVAVPNTLYYSYHNYTLILPNPNDLKLGVRVGLEQMDNDRNALGVVTGSGMVKYGTLTQDTSADYKVNIDGNGEITTTDEIAGSVLYYFIVVPDGEGSNNKTWSLEKTDSFKDYMVQSNIRLIEHLNDSIDPHANAGYLKIADIKHELSDLQDTAISPYGVKMLFEGLDTTMNVTKPELYKPSSSSLNIPANTIIKDEHIDKATTTRFGGVKIATDLDVANLVDMDNDMTLVVTPSQVNNRRLVHKNTWVTGTVAASTVEEDLKISNPVYSCLNAIINLPKPDLTLVSRNATVYVDLIKGTGNNSTVTVKCDSLALDETFINSENNSTLLLTFEASYYNNMNTFTWKYVV